MNCTRSRSTEIYEVQNAVCLSLKVLFKRGYFLGIIVSFTVVSKVISYRDLDCLSAMACFFCVASFRFFGYECFVSSWLSRFRSKEYRLKIIKTPELFSEQKLFFFFWRDYLFS